jgi:outer membrane protein TolC
MKFRTFIALIIILGAAQFVSAEVLTLDDCINQALKNNYGVISAQDSYETTVGQAYAAYGRILPSIDISTSGSKSWVGGAFDVFDNNHPVSKSYSGSLSIAQSYGGLGIGTYAGIRQSVHARNSAYYSYSQARSDLILQVKQNYYNVLQAKMLENVASDAVKRSEEGLRVAQSRYELGSASMSDVLKAKVQLGNDKLSLLTQSNNKRLALANLAFVMGMDVSKDFELPESLPERQVTVDFNQALNEALSKNPQYLRSQMQLAAARDAKLLSYSNLLPSLSYRVSRSNAANALVDFSAFTRQNPGYSASLSLGFNIFGGFGDYSHIRAARRNINTSRENVNNTKNNIALAVKQAFLDLNQAQEAITLSDESVAAAQEDIDLVREKYRLGAATILEVLDAEVSLNQAKTNQVQALFNYNLAVSRLENAMGR